jgi:hypothetical protein
MRFRYDRNLPSRESLFLWVALFGALLLAWLITHVLT